MSNEREAERYGDMNVMKPLGRDAERMARALKILANHHRLQMLCRMGMAGEGNGADKGAGGGGGTGRGTGGLSPTVGELVELTGLSQSRVSQHLALLREAGIVVGTREGQTVRYRLTDARIHAIMESLCNLCEDGLPPSSLDRHEERSERNERGDPGATRRYG